ncbi:MAG: metallophosphoesterase family protein [Oligoflexia bacterium]|nr:metallophosphoesterase family protein [Oligoflexia bacterium]
MKIRFFTSMFFASLTFAILIYNVGCEDRETVGKAPTGHVYLTWQSEDTSRTITVNVHSDLTSSVATVHYDTISHGGVVEDYKYKTSGNYKELKTINRRVHVIELKNLEPNTIYYFTVSNGTAGNGIEKKFKTIPADDSALTFVTGGDMNSSAEMTELNKQAAKYNPDFAMLGGDIAYDDGNLANARKWDEFFSSWDKNMVTRDGLMIPIVLAIGNHEVLGGYNGTFAKAPFYSTYFAQDSKLSYFTRKFGRDTIVYVLDTGHIAKVSGAQTDWLKAQMSKNTSIPNEFAIYHVPLYPSARGFSEQTQMIDGRKYWVPLFDQYKLTTAFENHDHALKRTKLLKNNLPDKDGTLYLGDGCWGKTTRTPDPTRYYLEQTSATRHFWVVKTSSKGAVFTAIDQLGKQKDTTQLAH